MNWSSSPPSRDETKNSYREGWYINQHGKGWSIHQMNDTAILSAITELTKRVTSRKHELNEEPYDTIAELRNELEKRREQNSFMNRLRKL